MRYGEIRDALSTELQEIRDQGLYKDERVISGPQGVEITVESGKEVLNFCANNYLGLSSHPKVIKAAGFMSATGRGTHEHCGVMGRVDLITTTFGKALGGASGGCTSGSRELIEMLRQRSRPYLFSNTLPPAVVGATIAVFDLLSKTTELRDRLEKNTLYFRDEMAKKGFGIRPGVHPIVPIMLYDAKLAQYMAAKLLSEGIYVIGFSYPVVPKGQARIRVQISAAHTNAHLDKALSAFETVGKKLEVVT